MSRTPAACERLVGDDADRAALDQSERADDVRREQLLHLQEFAVVDDRAQDVPHVVGLPEPVRHDRVETRPGGRGPRRVLRGPLQVVGGQVRQQVAHGVEGVHLVGGEEVGVAVDGVAGAGAAQFLGAGALAGDRLDDVGSGDEHVRGAVHHHGEVGDGGRVRGPAGARAQDDRDLRDHPGRLHVAAHQLGVEGERGDALLDAGAATVVEADDRTAGLQGEVHQRHGLLAEGLAHAAAEDRGVLGEDTDGTAVDRAVPGDHPVAVRDGGRRPRWAGPARTGRSR